MYNLLLGLHGNESTLQISSLYKLQNKKTLFFCCILHFTILRLCILRLRMDLLLAHSTKCERFCVVLKIILPYPLHFFLEIGCIFMTDISV